MIKEFCFPRITNSVEIGKHLSTLNFINVKLKSKIFFNGNFFIVQFTEDECKLHVKCGVAIYSDVQCQDCFECQVGKLKLQIIKVSWPFFNLGSVVFNFLKIEPTVSYKLFTYKKICVFAFSYNQKLEVNGGILVR